MNRNTTNKLPLKSRRQAVPFASQFAEVSAMILYARKNAFRRVDAILVELYWKIGEYISHRVASAEWGEGMVKKLAAYLEKAVPDARGFNRRGLYRMKQFYDTYAGNKKVSPLVTQIQWSNHLVILSATKTIEEKEFYLQQCAREVA